MNMLQNIFAHLNLNQYVCAAIWRLAFRSGRILVWCSSGDQVRRRRRRSNGKKTGRENVLYILTCKCASRHNGVQFFISHLASWLRTRCFSEPTFRPSGATNHWKKHSISRLSHLLGHLDLLSSETLFLIFFLLSSSFLFSSLLFSSLLFFDSYHLCISSVQVVGSLTSKLPSIIVIFCSSFSCCSRQG